MSRTTILIGSIVYLMCCIAIVFFWLPKDLTFVGDSKTYSLGAVNLLEIGTYSQDGIYPFIEREPLYSAFVAVVYSVFGLWNGIAVFAVQAVLYWLLSLFLSQKLASIFGKRTASIFFFLLLTSPSVLHGIFIVYREAFALLLLLGLSIAILSILERYRLRTAILIGVLLGFLPLAYYSFIFLPLFVLLYLWYRRVPKKALLWMFVLTAAILSFWGFRNQRIDGHFRIIGSDRTTVMLYARGEQAERLHGVEPFLCLWAEYVSRDWTGRSDACSVNSLMHRIWPSDQPSVDTALAPLALEKIRSHFGWYLWDSLFQILELHLPFVGGGWPFLFNLFAAIGSAIIYVGCLLAFRSLFDRRMFFFLLLIAYNTAFFALIAATPRYLIPVSFCYAMFAAIGYDKLLSRLGFPPAR